MSLFPPKTRAKQREVSSKGGRSVSRDQRPFSTNHELAVKAGRKGGTTRGKNEQIEKLIKLREVPVAQVEEARKELARLSGPELAELLAKR